MQDVKMLFFLFTWRIERLLEDMLPQYMSQFADTIASQFSVS